MIPNDPDQALDTLLRRSSELESIPDAGFSNRVLAALPSPRKDKARVQNRLRAVVCVVGAGVGTVAAVIQGSRLPQLASVDLVWTQLADTSLRVGTEIATTIDLNLPVLAQIIAALGVAALVLADRPSRSPDL